ncbi:MAG: VanZ family protein [Candidatus Krumholzibacteria bacterium]|nr:VanZ family protein [Candidatus Krumholzibacteria bacterium]
MRIRLLPIAVAMIAVVTAVSVEVSPPFLDRVTFARVQKLDILYNILLYLPLGIALRRSVLKCALVAAAMSISAEALQLFYPERIPSPTDLLSNTGGAILGAWTSRWLYQRRGWNLKIIRVGHLAGALATAVFLLFIVALSRSTTTADLSNWDPRFHLAVGNEPTDDRSWRGDILEMMILDKPVDRRMIRRLSAAGPGLLHSRRNQIGEGPLFGIPYQMSPDDSLWGRPLMDESSASDLCRAIVASGTLSLLVWFRTHDAGQIGPARIATFSQDPFACNFMLGQERRRLNFRLRTPITGETGLFPQTITTEFIDENRDFFVAAIYDGRVSRVYTNGRLVGRRNLEAEGRLIPFLADSGLPAALFVAGGLLAAGVLGLAGRGRMNRWLLGGIAGVAATGLIHLAGGVDALPEFARYTPFFGLAGGLVVAASSLVRVDHGREA